MVVVAELLTLFARSRVTTAYNGNAKVWLPCMAEAVERAKHYVKPNCTTVKEFTFEMGDISRIQHLYVLREMLKTCGLDRALLEYLGSEKLNASKVKALHKYRSHTLLVNLFYNSSSVFNARMHYRWVSSFFNSREYFVSLGSHLLYDAYGLGAATLDPKYRTSEVMAMLMGMRKEMHTDALPYIADALQDAGFGDNKAEAAVLENYRDRDAPHSLGSWIFRAAGVL